MADEPSAPAPEEPLKAPDTLGLGEKPEGSPPSDDPNPAEPAAEPESPIVYEDFTLPEGVELNSEQVDDFKKFAAERKLSQEDAQSLVDRHTAAVREAAEAPIKLWVETQKKWEQEVRADPEIGGDNLPMVKATVAKALDKYGGEGIREALNLTGAGNNPAIIRMFYRMAKELTEGGPGPSGNPPKGQRDPAKILYPDNP